MDKLSYKNLFLQGFLLIVIYFLQYLAGCTELRILKGSKLILLCQNVNIMVLKRLVDFRLCKPAGLSSGWRTVDTLKSVSLPIADPPPNCRELEEWAFMCQI